jgi:hypothetical protein
MNKRRKLWRNCGREGELQGKRKMWIAARNAKKNKKEEFSGIMRCMGPENSFPQICVVSGMSMF